MTQQFVSTSCRLLKPNTIQNVRSESVRVFFYWHAAPLKMIELGPWGVLVRKFRGAYRPITAFYEFERKLGEAVGIGIVA